MIAYTAEDRHMTSLNTATKQAAATAMTYFESLKAATGTQYKAILCQHLGAAKDRHVSAIRAWLSNGTKSAFAEMISAEAHIKEIEGAIARGIHE
jgi:hypothetical protein